MLAADYAIETTKNNNAELIALNVIHVKYLYSPSYVWRPVSPNTINSIIKKQEEEAKRWLAIPRTEFIIDPMSIVGAIVEYAERENIDLLVIGSRDAYIF